MQPGYRVLGDLIVQGHGENPQVTSHTDVLAAVKAAVERGEDVNQRDIDDVAPISRAVEVGNLPVVIYLLSKGADVEAKDAYLLRPVHYAASLGHATILRVLASRLPQASFLTPSIANWCQDLLKSACVRCQLELTCFCRCVWLFVQQVQSQKGKRVPGLEAQDARGNTPLHCAARNGHLDCVQLLLDAGVESIDSHKHLLTDAPLGRTVRKTIPSQQPVWI